MFVRSFQALRLLNYEFRRRSEGSVALVFALAMMPILTGVGVALDYSRASAVKAEMQSALDSAVLAGARDASSNWKQVALDVFNGNLSGTGISAPAPALAASSDGIYSASAAATVPTAILGIIRVDAIDVGARAAAKFAEADDSCILTLDKGQSRSHVSLSLNGAPIVNLSGCSIRSNTSMDCNGNDGSVTKAVASGSASGCGNPKPNAAIVPDTFADLAKNITTSCGSLRPGVTWTPGTEPMGSGIKKEVKDTHVEYHVCGDLTLSGTGSLTGNSPASDVVIVIENGSLILANDAAINTVKTAIVMTGNGSSPARVAFPNGAGNKASLSLSPPTNVANPWQAVALYLDPKLTANVNNTWGPGAEFNADGLVYLGTSNLVTDGNTASNNSKCTKFVANSFTTNGKVNLNFAQQNCAAIGLKQWGGIVVHLIK